MIIADRRAYVETFCHLTCASFTQEIKCGSAYGTLKFAVEGYMKFLDQEIVSF